MKVTIDPGLQPIVGVGVLVFEGVEVRADDERLARPLAAAAEQARRAPPPERNAVRAMYRRTGLDPTRVRPSSEALLRRVRRGAGLPRVNTLVDVCNWCSLEVQLPYGLYDADRVRGDITLRTGRPGEEYPGIRKDAVHLEGRLTLADAAGPFGNPTSDSARTMVTTGTVRAIAVLVTPRDLVPLVLAAALELTSARVIAYAGGRETTRLTV